MERKELEALAKAYESIQDCRTDLQRIITFGEENKICLSCGKSFMPRKFEPCPECGSINSKKLKLRRVCQDCGHRWEPMRLDCCIFCSSSEIKSDPKTYPYLNSLIADLLELEKRCLKGISAEVREHPVWQEFGQYIRGFGLTSWAIIYARTDIERCDTLSKFYAHIGFALKKYCESCHQVFTSDRCPQCGREVVPTVQKKHKGVKLDYDARLQSRFILVGKSLLGATSFYFHKYQERRRKEDTLSLSARHQHNRAFRFMIKLFGANLWEVWRELEGFSIPKPYPFQILQHDEGSFIHWQEVVRLEKEAKKPIRVRKQ